MIAIVSYPVGPACAVRLEDGRLVRGYRVADDYRPLDHEVVYRGEPIRLRYIGPTGRVVEDEHGQQQIGPKPGGGTELQRYEEATAEITPIEPPPLTGPLPRLPYPGDVPRGTSALGVPRGTPER